MTPDAAEVAAALGGAPVPVRDAEFSVPTQSGLYAWWSRTGTLPGISGRAHPNQPVELLYVGLATDLQQRVVRRHVRGGTGASTLRRTLAALLPEEGFQVRWTTTRVVLESADERRFTDWIRDHLLVSWVEHPEPAAVEAEVISLLAPPLNGDHNAHHQSHAYVRGALAAWRERAGPRPIPS